MLISGSVWRLPIIIVACTININLLSITQPNPLLKLEKLWQYGKGTIYSFDWLNNQLVLATSSGIQVADASLKPLMQLDEGGIVARDSILVSPNGTQIVTRDSNNLRIRDSKTGKILHTLVHNGPVLNFAWRPDGKSIAVDNYDTTSQRYNVALWSAETGETIRTIGNYDGRIVALAWHPDGNLLAVNINKKQIIIEDTDNSRWLRTLNSTSLVTSLAWSPDGSKLAGSLFNGVSIWRTDTFEQRVLGSSHRFYATLAWNADGTRVAGSLADGGVGILNIENNTVAVLPATNSAMDNLVTRVAWQGSVLAILDNGRRLNLWDTTTNTIIIGSDSYTGDLLDAAVSPNGQQVALLYAYSDQVIVLDGSTGIIKQNLLLPPGYNGRNSNLGWNSSSDQLAVGNTVSIFSYNLTPDLTPALSNLGNFNEPDFSWLSKNELLIADHKEDAEKLLFFDSYTGNQTRTAISVPGLQHIQASPDGKQIALYRRNIYPDKASDSSITTHQIDILNLQDNTTTVLQIPTVSNPSAVPLDAFLWLPDGSGLIGISGEGTLWRWNVSINKVEIILAGEPLSGGTRPADRYTIKINPRGDWLLVVNQRDGQTNLLDVTSGKILVDLTRQNITKPEWVDNDSFMGYDGTLSLWRVSK